VLTELTFHKPRRRGLAVLSVCLAAVAPGAAQTLPVIRLGTGLAEEKEGRFKIGNSRIHLPSNSPLISKHHTNWRVKAIQTLEDFHPARVANRILGMGDIVSLVERATENIDAEKAQAMAKKLAKGKFDLDDLADQLAQVEKIGGLNGIMGMLPGMGKLKDQLSAASLDDRMIKRQRAIILSMTPQERRNPDILKASRKKRIAAGAGMRVEDVNRLLKQHRQMADMMKSMGGMKGGGMRKMAGMMGGLMGGGGNPFGAGGGMPQPTPEQIAALQKQMGGAGGMPSLHPGLSLPKGLPGLGSGGGLPGLGGFNPFGKKK